MGRILARRSAAPECDTTGGMSDLSVSRRTFVALAGAAAQAQNRESTPARSGAGPIRIVTMYKFEPEEIRVIEAAVPNTPVEIIMTKDRDEFHTRLREAEVVYG